jgi:carbon monoxide dehydrogenase subunit G
MASLYRETSIAAPADAVWSALRDVGNAHRVFAGVLTDARMDGDGARIVTFANGLSVRELIVTIDDAHRRCAYTVVGSGASHHHASFQVFDDGAAGCRVVWITDVLPHEAAAKVAPLMDAGSAAMQRTLEAASSTRRQLRGDGIMSANVSAAAAAAARRRCRSARRATRPGPDARRGCGRSGD